MIFSSQNGTFGMTRTGKSNTVKILIKSIKEAAQKHGKKGSSSYI